MTRDDYKMALNTSQDHKRSHSFLSSLLARHLRDSDGFLLIDFDDYTLCFTQYNLAALVGLSFIYSGYVVEIVGAEAVAVPVTFGLFIRKLPSIVIDQKVIMYRLQLKKSKNATWRDLHKAIESAVFRDIDLGMFLLKAPQSPLEATKEEIEAVKSKLIPRNMIFFEELDKIEEVGKKTAKKLKKDFDLE